MVEFKTFTKILPEFLNGRKILVQIVLCSICLGILYFPVFTAMVSDWMHLPDFSHGFIVPFISLYFVWQRRDKLWQLTACPRNSGVAVVFFGLMLLLVGNLGAESFTMRFSFLVVVAGIILFLLGWPHLRILFFPVAFLIFMIPIPSILMQRITFPLQLFASRVSVLILQQIGIPVLREGNIINLANTSLQVAEACSGIRSLVSLLALATVFAYFSKKLFWQRAVLILSSFPIAIFVNVLRVSTTGFLAHYSGLSVAEGFFHGFSGYLLFLVALVLLAGLGVLLAKFKS